MNMKKNQNKEAEDGEELAERWDTDNILVWWGRAWRNWGVSTRSPRIEYWSFTLLNILFLMILAAVGSEFVYMFVFAWIIPSITLTIRRLHDTDRSGWNILWSLMPFIGGILLLVYMVQKSDPNKNQYG